LSNFILSVEKLSPHFWEEQLLLIPQLGLPSTPIIAEILL